MKKTLLSVAVIAANFVFGQINIFENFENPTSVAQRFSGGPFTLNSGNQYVCSGKSLIFDEFGYGSMIAYPTTVQFKTSNDDIVQSNKDINLSFKYKWKNNNFQQMKVVVRYEISGCTGSPITGNFNDIFINSTDFTGNSCLDYSATIPKNLLQMSFCTVKIFFDLYSTSTTGTSTVFIIDDFRLSQTTSLAIEEIKSQNKLSAFPIPANKTLNIINPQNGANKIQIYDTSGKLILNKMFTSYDNKIALDVEYLPKGNYIYKIGNLSSKFIKN